MQELAQSLRERARGGHGRVPWPVNFDVGRNGKSSD